MMTPATTRTTISVDVASTARAISPDLFGAFFEDLNHAVGGAPYAELVQNPSFEYNAEEAAGTALVLTALRSLASSRA
jgi:hypothetical protein